MATKRAFWISYDLGLKGDYTGLYSWLDSVKAIECGNGVAFFTKTIEGDLANLIKSEIEKNVNLEKTDRIYLIYKESNTGKLKGKFLHGGRKRASWEGFAAVQSLEEDSAE